MKNAMWVAGARFNHPPDDCATTANDYYVPCHPGDILVRDDPSHPCRPTCPSRPPRCPSTRSADRPTLGLQVRSAAGCGAPGAGTDPSCGREGLGGGGERAGGHTSTGPIPGLGAPPPAPLGRESAGDLVPVGEPFQVQGGSPAWRRRRLLRQAGQPRRPQPCTSWTTPAFFTGPGFTGRGGDYPDNHIRFAFSAWPALAGPPGAGRNRSPPCGARPTTGTRPLAPLYLRTNLCRERPPRRRRRVLFRAQRRVTRGTSPPAPWKDPSGESRPSFYELALHGVVRKGPNLLKGGWPSPTWPPRWAPPTPSIPPAPLPLPPPPPPPPPRLRTAAGRFWPHTDVFVGLRDRLG